MKAIVEFDDSGGMKAEGDQEAVGRLYKMYMSENTKADLAQSLADALEAATDQLEKAVSGERIDTKAVNQILERSALAAYRAIDPRADKG